MTTQPTVAPLVVLGGGFAGSAAARALTRRFPDREIVLVSRDNFITYNPLLPEVVGASIAPVHAVAPLRQLVPKARVMNVTITDIDLAKRELHYLGEGEGLIRYDQLVLAYGNRPQLDLVPGMARYALPLKSLGDALFLRNRLMARLEQADLVDNAEQRQRLLQFVVVGGGFSGVEVAGEIQDFLRAALRFYPRVKMDEVGVTLLHKGDCLLPELPMRLGQMAGCAMRRDGIKLLLGARVERVDDSGVRYRDCEGNSLLVPGSTVICTIGTATNPLTAMLPVAIERGRVVVAPDLSVPDQPGLWAIGDCAAVPNAADGTLSPTTAQFADRQGKWLANNLWAASRGRPSKPFRFTALGQLSSIGHNAAVADVLKMQFSGVIGFLLWRAVYLMKMPTFARKARVFLEWNWDMFFAQDIAHLKFTRSPRM